MSYFDTDFNTLRISLADILIATHNFAEENLLKRGGKADAYKGFLFGIDVVIRIFSPMSEYRHGSSFYEQIKIISRVKHRNFVSLFGFCDEEDERMIVMERVVNGSLHKYISDPVTLTWSQRLRICYGSALALRYWKDNIKGVYVDRHRSMDTSKILLDKDWEAKVHCFGYRARCFEESSCYKADPWCYQTYTDVYYLGLMLLEVLYGREILDILDMVGYVYQMELNHCVEGELDGRVDPYRRNQMHPQSLSIFSETIHYCLKDGPLEGADMNRIVERLEEALDLQWKHENPVENGIRLASKTQQHFNEGIIKNMVDPRMMGKDQGCINTIVQRPNEDSLDTFPRITHQCLVETTSEHPTILEVVDSLEKAIHLHEHFEQFKIPLSDILLATENFDEKYLLGSGGYGAVYKAKLNNFNIRSSLATIMKSKDEHLKIDNTVAIKRIFHREDGQGKEGFLAELEALSKCEHPNIVRLLGFCVEDNEMLLAYEHAFNGSLDDYLGSTNKLINLTWTQRLKMCIGIAQGLNYLHTTTMEAKKRIIHRDIKSDNILLDKNWEAKIADFGLSRCHTLNHQQESTIETIHIAGTNVYLDPEYSKTGRLKKASDIYSFGVVLFEIFSGTLAYDPNYTRENVKGIAAIARRHFKKGTLKEMLDPKIMDVASELGFTGKVEPDHDSLKAFLKIAYQCIAKTQAHRPTAEDVIAGLTKALHFQENQFMKTLKISLEDVKLDAENFNGENIKKGGYGMLYNGKVQFSYRQKKVLVKPFSLHMKHGFLKEFEVLFKHKQENIIGLLGYCTEMNENFIFYEKASKGSLDRCLKDASISWTRRLKICIDIAKGLKFLHGGDTGQDVVIHRDIKSSNILLTKDWKAKICGFELALTYPTNEVIKYVKDHVVSSPGYCDPLYRQTHILTKESDMYSFGVVLFEILCGRLACPTDFRTGGLFLDVLVKRRDQIARLDEIVFRGIKEQIAPKSLSIFQRTAFLCLHEEREKRPTAVDVVIQLQKALEVQEGYEIQEGEKLQSKCKEILRFSESPEVYSKMAKKYISHILSKGILFDDDKREIIRVLQQPT